MDKILSQIQSFSFLSYSAFAIYGIVAVYIVTIPLCIKKQLEWLRILPAMIFSFVGLGLGAKLFGILSTIMYNLDMGIEITSAVITNSGIVFYGGLLGYLAMSYVILWRIYPANRHSAHDIIATTIPLFHGFARIGCYFAGCCYGLSWEGPLCVVAHDGGHFPIMLVEAAFNFLLFTTLVILLFKKESLKGRLMRLYLWSYSLFRFAIEFFRGDEIRGSLGPFSFSQYVSMGIIIFLVITLLKNRGRAQQTYPNDMLG